MILKKRSKNNKKRVAFGWFFAILMALSGVFGIFSVNSQQVYAEPNGETQETTTENNEPENTTETNTTDENKANEQKDKTNLSNNCQASLEELAWLVCPLTEKVAEATDWLYDKIEGVLAIEPISTEDGTPIYEIWKYARGVTNIVFIIFLLVVIYSQITGVGISNYGIKKVLPKLIVVAILVNLSFLICSLAVDLSNVIGNGLRGVFSSVEETVMSNMAANAEGAAESIEDKMTYAGMYGSLAGGTALTVIGIGLVGFESGAIWLLIPVLLGAFVAVASGLITIALRQAVVALLIMISPLAIVAYMLPNTESLFKKWKDLLVKMLIFYPMFSLLFGASNLAGFAIMASSKDGFGVLLGTAVKIFPLFFSWSLMKMSGTFLGNINAKIRGLAEKPLAANRAWAESHRQLTRAKHLAAKDAYIPSRKLSQFLADRKVYRSEKTKEYENFARNRGLAYTANRNYRRDGTVSTEGERKSELMTKDALYAEVIERDKNNYEKGLSDIWGLARNDAQAARLRALDTAGIRASDRLKTEQARGDFIKYKNAESYHNRMQDAINVHFDDENEGREKYVMHENIADRAEARARYSTMRKIMEGSADGAQYVASVAAQGYDAEKKITETRMGKYFELTPATQDVEHRLGELTTKFQDGEKVSEKIDLIMPGLRTLNQRGDTDILRRQIENVLSNAGGVELGTYASQSLANFLMFEVKDNDPFLRRFGKYINLETARVFNEKEPEKRRHNAQLTLNEYITGEYEDWEYGHPERKIVGKAKRPMTTLMEGTSLDNVERTAYSNLDEMLTNAYTKDGRLDVDKYLKKRNEIETAIGPAFISASLKYLSGSEQLKSAVSFLTGYDGNKAKWEDEGNPLYGSKEAEKYFREKTLKYLKDQTPTQILGLRSDYYNALLNHLANEYEEADTEDWSDEAVQERDEFMKKRAEIQTRYGDLPADEAKKKRDEDLKKLREEMAGAQFRQVLDSKGKLNQIYITRRSGAANNAKDWVRKWLDLDNEPLINIKLNDYREKTKKDLEKAKRQREKNKAEGDTPTEEPVTQEVYTKEDRAVFTSYVDNLWQDLRDIDDESFYKESLDYVEKNLGKESFIATMYKKYRKDNPDVDSHTLKEFLIELLSDSDNY